MADTDTESESMFMPQDEDEYPSFYEAHATLDLAAGPALGEATAGQDNGSLPEVSASSELGTEGDETSDGEDDWLFALFNGSQGTPGGAASQAEKVRLAVLMADGWRNWTAAHLVSLSLMASFVFAVPENQRPSSSSQSHC